MRSTTSRYAGAAAAIPRPGSPRSPSSPTRRVARSGRARPSTGSGSTKNRRSTSTWRAALTGIPVKATVAMTGEITLRGEVLPIGGLKEKLLAAHRAGIKEVIIPHDNKRDLKEMPANIKQDLTIHDVRWIDEVLTIALAHMPEPVMEKPKKEAKIAKSTKKAASTAESNASTH